MSFVTQNFVKKVSPTLPHLNNTRIAVIFGNVNSGLVHGMSDHLAQLYTQKRIQKIIVTGGKSFSENNHTEAEYARKILLSKGVLGRHIMIDNHSMNSYENVKNARRLLFASEGQVKREPVLFLGMDYATRRFLMTIAKNWPEAIPSFIGFDSFQEEKHEWHTCPRIAQLLETDETKWPEYIAKGHIKPVNIRHMAWDIHRANKPRKLGR